MPGITARPDRIHWLRRGLYWTIPIVILLGILRNVDFQLIRLRLSGTEMSLVAFGVLISPLVTLLGGLRWYLCLSGVRSGKRQLGFVLRHYWIGLSLGFFSPSSVVFDAYRVGVSGGRYGKFGLNAMVIVLEKVVTLISCAAAILVLLPLIQRRYDTGFSDVIDWVVVLILGLGGIGILWLLFAKRRAVTLLSEKVEDGMVRILRVAGHASHVDGKPKIEEEEGQGFGAHSGLSRRLFWIFGFSIAILLVNAWIVYILFAAVGCHMELVANVFVAACLSILLSLPISLGGLGVREGAYIVLYGPFGASAETSLVISFFALCGILLNHLIGGILATVSNLAESRKDRSGGNEEEEIGPQQRGENS